MDLQTICKHLGDFGGNCHLKCDKKKSPEQLIIKLLQGIILSDSGRMTFGDPLSFKVKMALFSLCSMCQKKARSSELVGLYSFATLRLRRTDHSL